MYPSISGDSDRSTPLYDVVHINSSRAPSFTLSTFIHWFSKSAWYEPRNTSSLVGTDLSYNRGVQYKRRYTLF